MRPNPIDWPQGDTARTGWKDHLVTLAELIKHEIVEAEGRGATQDELKPMKIRFNRAIKSAGLKIGR